MSDIEKADKIVGINRVVIDALARINQGAIDTYRRGAFADWLVRSIAGRSHQMTDSDIAHNTTEDMAKEIVRLHKPNGDGLPENLVAWCSCMNGCECVRVALEDEKSMPFNVQVATREYIHRCLSATVRRLLAAFDVVEPGAVFIEGSLAIENPDPSVERERLCRQVICRLIPRAAR